MIKYYVRSTTNRIIATVAVKEEQGIYSRGVAITSPRDNPSRKIGTAIAIGRLNLSNAKAVREHSHFSDRIRNSCYVRSKRPSLVGFINSRFISKEEALEVFKAKSQYNITPTFFEKKLLATEREHQNK